MSSSSKYCTRSSGKLSAVCNGVSPTRFLTEKISTISSFDNLSVTDLSPRYFSGNSTCNTIYGN